MIRISNVGWAHPNRFRFDPDSDRFRFDCTKKTRNSRISTSLYGIPPLVQELPDSPRLKTYKIICTDAPQSRNEQTPHTCPHLQDHLVLADMGCRNTVFNARAQSGGWWPCWPCWHVLSSTKPAGRVARAAHGDACGSRCLPTPCHPALTGLFYGPELLRAGYGRLRVELVDEPAECVAPLLQGYR